MVFLVGIVLTMVFIIPAAWFPFQLGKVALFALTIALTSVLFVSGRGTRELVRSHGFYLALLVGLLPLVYVLSTLVMGTAAVSLTGFAVEVDTVLFTTIAFLGFLLSFGLFKTLRTVRLLATTIMWTLVGIVAFQWVVVLLGTTVVPFALFTDKSINLIGKWNDLGLVAGLLAMFLLVRAELTRESWAKRSALGVGLLVVTLLLALINFFLAWWFILVASLIIGLTSFMTQRIEERAERQSNPYAYSSWAQKAPWFSLAAACISILFLLYGGSINQGLTSRFPVSSLEVRPSYGSTYEVISKAREGSVASSLIGTGPNTFSTSWTMHKPPEVNQSNFWNLDFNVGFSTLVTALGTVGLLGAIAWIIPLLLVLAGSIRVVRLSLLSREERATALTVGLGALFLLGAVMLYVPSPNLILLAFVLSGAVFGYLWRQGRHTAPEEAAVTSFSAVGTWAMIALLLIVSLGSAFISDRRFVAQAKNNTGAASLQAGNADEALLQAKKSQGIEVTSDNLRLTIEAGILKMNQLANSSQASSTAVQQQFLDIASSTIATAKKLSDTYPADYRSYFTVGRVYDQLAALKVQGAYENAEQAYQKALTLNASAPDIALALARLEASQGKAELTQKYLSQSLTLKPNYTDAILLVVQLNVANNDIPNAIRAAQAAAQSAPGVAPIWFQLGLLYYANNDTAGAITPLETAVKIVPDYANAKYFLGLSYYAQKKTAEALAQFEDLNRSNPSSPEVQLILSNMRAGKAPFDSAQPPITPKPQNRPDAPLNE